MDKYCMNVVNIQNALVEPSKKIFNECKGPLSRFQFAYLFI